MSLYCTGRHRFRTVSEPGRTPYRLCRCGKAELIPGAQPTPPNAEDHEPAIDRYMTVVVFAVAIICLFIA